MRFSLSFAALAFTSLAATGASAQPDAARVSLFQDRGRAVALTRLPSTRTAPDGHALRDVELTYDDLRIFRASIDATAIVKLAPGAEPAVDEAGGRVLRPLMPSAGLWLVEDAGDGDGADLAERLSGPAARARGVLAAAPNLYLATRRFGDYVPNDPRFPGQWYFENLKMSEAWGLSQGDPSTTVVVVDTGCDYAHPDLASKLDPGRDVVDGDDDANPVLSDSGAAHGTSCAGIVGAATNNGEGIAGGCPECRLRCVRLLSDAPTPVSADVDAFQFALDVDAAVVSNSWGFVEPIPAPAALADAITNVATNGRGGKGAVVLFAAGNDDREVGTDEIEGVEGVICVGAINNFDESTPFTNYGPVLDVVAPTGTLTTDISGSAGEDPTDYTSLFGGTSSACPVAAGVAALLVSAAPEKTGAEIGQLLIDTTRPAPYAVPDQNGHDPVYGYGIIDPPKALKVALGLPTGEGGAGGAGGASAGGAGTGGAGSDTSEGDGCGCRTAPSTSPGSLSLAWLGALALLGLRRRRPRL